MTSETMATNLLAYFGQQLRRLRTQAGMTQEELGGRIGYSSTMIGMVEKGRRAPSQHLADAADRVLDGRGVLAGLWLPIQEQATPDEQVGQYLDLESRAAGIDTYEAHLVPGLLQTEAYARAVMGHLRPPVPPGEVAARVALRLSRQEILVADRPPALWAIIGEAVLHRQLGDHAMMRDQLTHLLTCRESHAVTLQVLPFTTPDPAMGVSFTLLSFAGAPPIVYLDVLTGAIYHRGNVDAVSRHQSVFNYLREAAMSEGESVALIAERRRALSR